MRNFKPRHHRVAVVYNTIKEEACTEWRRLNRWLKARHISVIGGPEVTREMKQADFLVVLGGDGTLLNVAREVCRWNLPLLGVNVGRLGFLTATDVDSVYRTLKRILAGEGRVEKRAVLSVTATASDKPAGPFLGLNECVIRSESTGRVAILQALIQNRPLATYVGDGLIVSTPTGSTAYSLAASGPIIHPDLDVLLLCPICPHALSQRPLLVPTSEVIAVQVDLSSQPATVSLDGQEILTLLPGDQVEIRQGAERVHLLMGPEYSFYEVLKTKLKWGGTLETPS
jgi:NAD+ kinase